MIPIFPIDLPNDSWKNDYVQMYMYNKPFLYGNADFFFHFKYVSACIWLNTLSSLIRIYRVWNEFLNPLEAYMVPLCTTNKHQQFIQLMTKFVYFSQFFCWPNWKVQLFYSFSSVFEFSHKRVTIFFSSNDFWSKQWLLNPSEGLLKRHILVSNFHFSLVVSNFHYRHHFLLRK